MELTRLVAEFRQAYLPGDEARTLLASYAAERTAAQRNYALLATSADQQDAAMLEVLTKLLPHAATAANRWRGAWLYHTPIITTDIRTWYEASGRTQPDEWPLIAQAIWRFVRRCVEEPRQCAAACAEFCALPYSKGFQAGMLSPMLNALRPAHFLALTNKNRQVLNYALGARFSQMLSGYPAANAALQQLLERLAPLLIPASNDVILSSGTLSDHFELFCHWLISLLKFPLHQVRCWSIALAEAQGEMPSDALWQWQEWQDGCFIALGWEELGDLSVINRAEFLRRCKRLRRQQPAWRQQQFESVWRFARQLHEGDRVAVTLGGDWLLASGIVIGAYYYTPDLPFAHRLPVQWEECVLRRLPAPINQPLRRSEPLRRNEAAEFESLLAAPPVEQPLALLLTPRTAQTLHHQPPSFLALAVPVVETLRQSGGVLSNHELAVQLARTQTPDGEAAAHGGQPATTPLKNALYRLRRFLVEFGWIEPKAQALWRLTDLGKEAPLSWPHLQAMYAESEYQRRLERSYEGASAQIRQLAEQTAGYTTSPSALSEAPVITQTAKDLSVSPEIVPPEIVSAQSVPPAISPAPATAPSPVYPLSECAVATFLNEELLAQWVEIIERKGQAIFYGPPGTGKTFLAKQLACHLVGGDDGFFEVIQFHPAYEYEDFVQGIRPQATPQGLTYRVTPGRFLDFCRRAAACHGRCVLIIDEINRANLARVFGEVMHLLEYRNEAVRLAADGALFHIPVNVRIIGAMNTADRSIAFLDYALRRRFAFIALHPDYEVLGRFHRQQRTPIDVEALIDLLQRLNQQIGDPHYALGVSFFLRPHLDAELEMIWRSEIEPYLEEFFFDQPERLAQWRWQEVLAKQWLHT
jgi:hypothetical protein